MTNHKMVCRIFRWITLILAVVLLPVALKTGNPYALGWGMFSVICVYLTGTEADEEEDGCYAEDIFDFIVWAIDLVTDHKKGKHEA